MASRRRRFRSRPKPQPKRPLSNEQIDAPELRLIGVDGEQLGVIATSDALNKAEEAEVDLVIVAQKASPPVARLMDIGKHMYELRKKQAKQKSNNKVGDIKGVRISFKIDPHDADIRLRRADTFLTEGHKVKVEMRLRGREKGLRRLAEQKIREFISNIPGGAEAEGGLSHTGNNISTLLIRPRRSKSAPTPVVKEEVSQPK